MRKADVVIIGGSAAGITAAITSKRHYPDKSVLIIRMEERVLIPCGIPYIFGTVGSPDKNLMPDSVLEKNGIDLLVAEVTNIDRVNHIVSTSNAEEINYQKLVLATGSVPNVPPIKNKSLKNIFSIKKDINHLRRMLEQLNQTSNLVIVGGGFIGAEFADECRKRRNIKITIVEMLSHCLMLTFDEDLCDAAETIERNQGIDILAPERVEAFLGKDTVTGVQLASGKILKADMVIVSAGCKANINLAQEIGLEIGPTMAIKVDRYMHTSDENIFACGDCAEEFSFFDGKPSPLKLASIATKEARIVGANLFSTRRINEGVLGVFSTKLGNTAFGLAGLSEREAKNKGYDVVVGEAESVNRHPGAMPGAANLRVKLVFEKSTGILLGGQVMGAESGGELINTISACVHNRLTADNIALFPVGTHPALTASPVAYQLSNAAEIAIKKMKMIFM